MIMAIYGWYIDAAAMKESVINFYKEMKTNITLVMTDMEHSTDSDSNRMEHCLGNQNAAIRVLVNDNATLVE